MQYAELIEFEKLESVIQFRHADQADKIKRLIKTYVISDEMASKLIKLVFEQLRFDKTGDNKGLFIVGNYGTGKSHLMAVISSIAEKPELLADLNHQGVADAARQTIAGQFHLVRVELSAVQRSLRNCLTEEIEHYLKRIGVPFEFPQADQITNNKAAFQEMMAAFQAQYPEQGLLLVVDELLEFLSGRKDRELILDLSFLREIGEICQDLRFRFIAGVQETIFDNPRFKFAANELRRVKDRFEQILITRKDIKFVVSERLLKKNAEQKTKIRTYLSRFTKFYGAMNERLEEFVSLFPVHPDYIDIFERIIAVEQREVLKTLERAMQELLDQSVPENELKLLAYDTYWQTLRENFSFRADDEIREVIDCSQVLENRIEQAFTRPNYKAMALRIIHALSVHRLTTYNFYTSVGVTARELRDSLCLYQPGIEDLGEPADDLLSQVELVLREILKTVNRQFISANAHNGQYYLDLKKTEDFDAIIENRADIVENNELDRYYYAALRQLMEVTDEAYVSNFLVWQHELEWLSHKVTRQGYLFFGTPNERATAVPERDFYLYFIQPYDPPKYEKSAITADEVFFHLTAPDEAFHHSLRHYSAAALLSLTASGHPKSVYDSKAHYYLGQLIAWLQAHLNTAFQVTYQGRTLSPLDWTKGQKIRDLARLNKEERLNFREIVELVASVCLEESFNEKTPDYPVFSVLITGENRFQFAQEALRNLGSAKRTKSANSILDALKLLDGETLAPLNPQSQYARYIIEALHNKAQGQVLNHNELLPEYTLRPEEYALEPEFVLVIISALVYAGEVVLSLPGKKFNASDIKRLADTPLKDLLTFKHIERPKDFNIAAIKALFELLGLSTDLAIQLTQNKEKALYALRHESNERLDKLATAHNDLSKGLIFWGQPVLSQTELQGYQKQLTETKRFLESLRGYGTPAQFKNFSLPVEEIAGYQNGFETLADFNTLQTLLRELNEATAYLMAAEAVLPPEQGWIQEMNKVRENVLVRLVDDKERANEGLRYQIQQQLGTLQQTYRQIYRTAHEQARLNAEEEDEKQALLSDSRLVQLKKLAKINLMPQQQLEEWENDLKALKSCVNLSDYDLLTQAFCPHCQFKPTGYEQTTASESLAELSDTLEELHNEWTHTLLAELETVANSEQWELLQSDNQVLLEKFLNEKKLPEDINHAFLDAVEEALSGLEKVTFNFNSLQKAIIAGGFPVTPAELQRRINQYVQQVMKDKPLHKIRMVLE
jgi:anion-transporting  ArsA/GET3 family ATPase